MSGFAFDSNIVIDALKGFDPARLELERAIGRGGPIWLSRIVWLEVMSRGAGEPLRRTERFLDGFSIDEIDGEIASRGASLRRERPSLSMPDAIILASALVRGRVLVTRNTKDFPAEMPGIRIPYTL